MREKALGTFFNIDGANGRIVMPTPMRDTLNLKAFQELSALSVRDRLNQLATQLKDVELAYVEATVINWCGMDLAKMSFWDCLRWWSLGGHIPDGIDNLTFSYKLACGQTGLARAIFEDAVSAPNFAYSFHNPITKISRDRSTVTATTLRNESYTAKYLISTIPWSVLGSITWSPPVPDDKGACFNNVSMGNSTKIYAEVAGSEWDGWRYLSPCSELTDGIQFMVSAGNTPSGNARLVCFSLRDGKTVELCPDQDPERAVAAFKKVNPQLDIKRLVRISLYSCHHC